MSDARIVVIALSRNFGHQAALTAALDHVSGQVTVVMDGDLQDDPEVIPLFIEKYEEGFDVVYARRRRRKESWWLRSCYRLYYRSLARLSRLPLPLDAGDFSLISHRVVEQLRRAPERHRYLRGLRTWAGFRQVGIDVQRSARITGRSKYTIGRLAELAFDGIFSFSVVPIRAATLLGAMTVVLTSLFALFSLVAKLFFEQSPRGFTALILVITFVSGVHLLFLGIIGEYVGRIYDEAKGRPIYVIDRIIRTER
jgi:dolichol-phosphate mannosyltransferase